MAGADAAFGISEGADRSARGDEIMGDEQHRRAPAISGDGADITGWHEIVDDVAENEGQGSDRDDPQAREHQSRAEPSTVEPEPPAQGRRQSVFGVFLK